MAHKKRSCFLVYQSFKQFVVRWWRKGVLFFEQLVLKERSPRKLALSFCVGVYISFSPFVFMHTVMVFIFSWLFSLNLPAVWAGAFVNNPWTMVPCYAAGYVVGEFCLGTVCGVNTVASNPSFMTGINSSLTYYTGMKGVSLWSFLIGGNLLGLVLGVMLYPVLTRIFARLSARVYSGAKKTVMQDHEDSCSEQKSILRVRDSRQDRSGGSADR
jgi:hypothetical protein